MAGLGDGAGQAERTRLLALLGGPTVEAARGLLGCELVRVGPGGRLSRARIVETEAYLGGEDPAAHSFAGRTARTEPLWGPPGTVYVYLVYGLHHCLNLAVDRAGFPGCVLVRAAEPIDGGLSADACRGPGRLCRALGIDARLSGRHLFERDWVLTLREGRAPVRVGVAARVGITKAAERPLRFYDPASRAVSAPRPAGVSFAAVSPSPPGSARPAAVRASRRRVR